jgi:vacuolar-type H+-ATPase subunit H
MQKIVLDEIIKAEKEAEKTVQQAREKAVEIVAKADSEYNQTVVLAKEESHKKIQDTLAAAKQKAENDLAKAIKDSEDKNLFFLEKSYEQADKVAGSIVEMLVKPEYEKE